MRFVQGTHVTKQISADFSYLWFSAIRPDIEFKSPNEHLPILRHTNTFIFLRMAKQIIKIHACGSRWAHWEKTLSEVYKFLQFCASNCQIECQILGNKNSAVLWSWNNLIRILYVSNKIIKSFLYLAPKHVCWDSFWTFWIVQTCSDNINFPSVCAKTSFYRCLAVIIWNLFAIANIVQRTQALFCL